MAVTFSSRDGGPRAWRMWKNPEIVTTAVCGTSEEKTKRKNRNEETDVMVVRVQIVFYCR